MGGRFFCGSQSAKNDPQAGFVDSLEEHEAVIHNNRQREKTTEVKAREFSKLKEIEAERAKRRQLAELKQNREPVVKNSPPREETGKARDIAAKKVGMSGRTAETDLGHGGHCPSVQYLSVFCRES
ncbi:hypothetical protein DESC_930021 [Desulfosarcina cetonica]|nr:hypothetical protein DESC_930021 [Desulfosarcina cetonica]